MRLALNAFLAVSAVAFTAVCLPSATPVSAASCDNIKIIFARGSGQLLGDQEYQHFKTELDSALAPRNDIAYDFYELGTSSQNNHQYPATGLDFFNTISAAISAGTAAQYGNSVNEGVAELTSYISAISSSCPNTKFVLAGYSQGAQVITASTPKINPSRIIYAATFGDPKLYLPEGQGIDPPACHNQSLSDYRAYAPNCKTHRGSLGPKIPYQETGWTGKLGLYCNDQDLICGAGLNLSSSGSDNLDFLSRVKENVIYGHTSYVKQGTIKKAVKTITDKINTAFPLQKNSNNTDSNLILLDYTYVNEQFYPNLAEALYKIREIYISNNNSGLVFYNNSNLDYENYYFLKNTSPMVSVDSFWQHRLHWDVTTENSLIKRLNYSLEHQHWGSIYILASSLSDLDKTAIYSLQEKYQIKIKVIYLEKDGFKAVSVKTKSKEKLSTNPFLLFNGTAYAESINSSIENHAATFVSINDAPLGFTTEREINITGVQPGDKIILTPIKKDGSIGKQEEIVVGNLGYGNINETADNFRYDNTNEATNTNFIVNIPTTSMLATKTTTNTAVPLTPNCGKL